MTHGNELDHYGTCWVCGTPDVALTARGVCVDEYACSSVWGAARRASRQS